MKYFSPTEWLKQMNMRARSRHNICITCATSKKIPEQWLYYNYVTNVSINHAYISISSIYMKLTGTFSLLCIKDLRSPLTIWGKTTWRCVLDKQTPRVGNTFVCFRLFRIIASFRNLSTADFEGFIFGLSEWNNTH